MDKACVISYDLGTSGIKVVLVDTEGELIGYTTAQYPLITPAPGWAEQDPVQYWRALCECTRRLLTECGCSPKNVKGISLCTQWKGIIPVDGCGNVLHNSMIWLDARAEKQAAILNKALSTDAFTGQSYWARIMWLKEMHPTIYDAAECIFEANSFLKWKLTGQKAMDVSNDFIHSFDEKIEAYYDKILSAGGLDKRKFPALVNSTDLVGWTTEEAALATGLVPGIPIFGGCGDIPAIAIGSGCCGRHDVHAYFGSSGWIAAVVDHDSNSVRVPSSAFTYHNDIILFGMQSVGLTLNWAIEQFYKSELQTMNDRIFDYINEELKEIPAGSQRLIATPWLSGELPPQSEKARVAFINASAIHDRRHFVNAIMESVCYSMRWRKQKCEELLGHPIEKLNVVGGGACSSHWMQMLSDILEIPVHIPATKRNAGAIGGAYCALVGLGYYKSILEVKENIRIEKSYYPTRENYAEYRRMCEVFNGLYEILEPVFNALSG